MGLLDMDAFGTIFAFAANSGSHVTIMPCMFYSASSINPNNSWAKYVSTTFIREAPSTVFAFNGNLGDPFLKADTEYRFTALGKTNNALFTNGTTQYAIQWSGGTSLDLYIRDTNSASIYPVSYGTWLYCIL